MDPNFEHRSYAKSFEDAKFFLDEVWDELQTQMSAVQEFERQLALIRGLCLDRSVEAVDGSLTDAEGIWPSEILAILSESERLLMEGP